MERKSNYTVSWTTIYSLGLVPLIVVWGLAPLIDICAWAITIVAVGFIEIVLSKLFIQYPQGCGVVGWTIGWSMIVGGLCKLLFLWFGQNIPIILFLAPTLTLLTHLFESHNKRPSFCHDCIIQRGDAQERRLLGDFSRYEVQYIIHLLFLGGILTTLLSWGLFIYGIELESREGNYFYFYFPLALSLAIIFFETIRRILIQNLFDSHEKKSKQLIHDNRRFMICYTSIRIVVICQGKIYLQKADEDSLYGIEGDSGLDTPILQHQSYCKTLAEEKQLAHKTAKELLSIEKADLRHISSTTAPSYLRRVGQYLLFLPAEEQSRLNDYKGEWYSTEELNQLYHSDKLYPIFKELYARLYTIVNTARTYCRNGKRRFSTKGYTPTFSLQNLEKLDIEFDDPIWLYVSRHNEDKLLYRLHHKLQNLFHKKKPHA